MKAPMKKGGAVTALISLTAINFVCLYDRVQISGLAQPIKEEFGLSDTQLGLLSGTAFGLTYATMAIPLGWLSDRTNRIKLLSAALALWSLMTAFAAVTQNFAQLALSRIGVAVGESSFTPTAHSLGSPQGLSAKPRLEVQTGNISQAADAASSGPEYASAA